MTEPSAPEHALAAIAGHMVRHLRLIAEREYHRGQDLEAKLASVLAAVANV